MITFVARALTIIAMVAASPTFVGVGTAAEPTVSDVAACNEQAAQRTGANALPAPPGAAGPNVAKRAPDGSREPRELPAHGGVPVAGAPGAAATAPSQSGAAPGEKTDPTGSFITESPDPLLRGMQAERADDPVYRAAYRECMRARAAR